MDSMVGVVSKRFTKLKWNVICYYSNPDCPHYAGEEEWLQEKRDERAVERLYGKDNVPPKFQKKKKKKKTDCKI